MSSTRRGHSTPFFELLAHPRHEPAHAQQVVHELRKGLGAIFVAFGEFADHAFLEVDLELVAILHRLGRLRRLKDGVAHVDRVAKEDAGERVSDDQRNSGATDRDRRDLSRRAASKVRAADEDVSLPDLRGPGVAAGHALHCVFAELLLIEGIDRVLGRDDLVGVDVVAELPSAPRTTFGRVTVAFPRRPAWPGDRPVTTKAPTIGARRGVSVGGACPPCAFSTRAHARLWAASQLPFRVARLCRATAL